MSDVLLLNGDYLPLNTVSWRKALHLLHKDKVFPVEWYDDWYVRNGELQVPAVIALKRRVSFEERIKFSKENICIRDRFTCQYCGTKLRPYQIELEHVIPASRGGPKTFENIVASCTECNAYKGDRTPKEANMHLRCDPQRPSSTQYRMYKVAKRMRHPSWKKYAGIYSTFIEANNESNHLWS